MVTRSESQEIAFIRLSPKAVQKAVDETFKNSVNVCFSILFFIFSLKKLIFVSKDIYQSSEITSIKVGNTTKRAVFYGGEKNLTKDEDMTIQVRF